MPVEPGRFSPDNEGGKLAVERLHALLADDLKAVNALIVERMQSSVSLIPRLANHLIASGGKRLRPLVTLASSRMCGYAGMKHVNLAGAVEFIHTATLLHDDVIDESALRRGQATANVVWGNQATVLVGDFLFSRAFQLMVEIGSLGILDILSAASATIAEGEVMQLSATHDLSTNREMYMAVIEAKTAALFAAAAEVGAVIAGRPAVEARALKSFGHNLGVAYQLIDDVLDYAGLRATLGKNEGDDFREGKITLPVVLAFSRGNSEERKFWTRTMCDGIQHEADFKTARRLLEEHNALADTIVEARKFADAADAALDRFPDNAHRRALIDLAAFAVNRIY